MEAKQIMMPIRWITGFLNINKQNKSGLPWVPLFQSGRKIKQNHGVHLIEMKKIIDSTCG